MIVSAASQAQRSGNFITGIEHKESLQESNFAEGMPLLGAGAWDRYPDSRLCPPRSGRDGVSTLMEWKHGTRPTERLSRPRRQSL